MIVGFPPQKPPAPAKDGKPFQPQGWPPGLRQLVEHLARIGMPCWPMS